MLRYCGDGPLVVPHDHWVSAPWRSLLFKAKSKLKKEIYAFLNISPRMNNYAYPYTVSVLTMFGSEKPDFSLLALRFCFCNAHQRHFLEEL